MVLPATTGRVPRHTAERVNAAIAHETERSVAHHAMRGREAIDARLAALDHEWDVERTLEANAATIGLAGVLLAATVDHRWLVLPAAVTGFLLQHALQGWCPPVPVLRRLGFRTADEIGEERQALKALRGDYTGLRATTDGGLTVREAHAAVAAARR